MLRAGVLVEEGEVAGVASVHDEVGEDGGEEAEGDPG